MKELNDVDFDKAFKTRITEELPEFEEASWLKMEKKLRRRTRLVFLRYASILFVLLSFGIGFYLSNKSYLNKVDTVAVKNKVDEASKNENKNDEKLVKPEELPSTKSYENLSQQAYKQLHFKNQNNSMTKNNTIFNHAEKPTTTEISVVQNPVLSISNKTQEVIKTTQEPIKEIAQNLNVNEIIPEEVPSTKPEKNIKVKRKIPISVAIAAGPDFSSSKSLIGGKTGVSFGATISVGLTEKLSLQTGISYGSKNYTSSAYDYTFANPNTNLAIFSGIDAACEAIEIPLRASYKLSENQQRSIELNAGLSSYIMVKENYVFRYNKELNRADRAVNFNNANQHYLSVVELSATYNIKLSNKSFALGIEPYVKIPLAGIGEGNVPLKSSGISLKMRYDFNKK